MSNKKYRAPKFGHHLGFIYPLIWRILASNKHWSPPMWLKDDSALTIDIYVFIWWVIELLSITASSFIFNWHGSFMYFILILLIFRFIDLLFVLSSILIRGTYRRIGDWPSYNRVTLLVILNALEIMVLFAIFYYSFSILFPSAASFNPGLNSFFDSLYFSFTTGTTIGYGVPYPTGWISKLLSMMEGSSVLLLVITVISYISNSRRKPEDTEHMGLED